MATSTTEQLIAEALAGVVGNPYIPNEHNGVELFPSPQQAAMFICTAPELCFGGAAGGGKTAGSLMDALRFVDRPSYRAAFFRRTYPELAEPGGLIDTIRQWVDGTDAHYHETAHEARFPSGAVIAFRHILNDAAARRAGRGPTYQRIYIDEATTFRPFQIQQLGSRIRGPKPGTKHYIPKRTTLMTNPGGEGHQYVFERYVDPATAQFPFIASRVQDNPGLDVEEYVAQLRRTLDPVTLARMLEGDWGVIEGGSIFDRKDFKHADKVPEGTRWVRSWDLAATTGEKSKRTAGVLIGICPAEDVYIADVQLMKERPSPRNERIKQTAIADGKDVPIRFEREGGSAGVDQEDALIRMLIGWSVEVSRDTGDKFVRANPFASYVGNGNVYLISPGRWIGPFLDELHSAQPGATYLDQMDAAAAGFNYLTGGAPVVGYTRDKSKTPPPAKRRERLFPTRDRQRMRLR